MRRHIVEFYSPGTFMSEVSSKNISSWSPEDAAAMAKEVTERYNATPYGFRFKTLVVADDVDDGEGGKLQVKPRTVETSGMHFLGGRIETLDEVVMRNDPKEAILRDNMQCNEMFIVCCNTENRWRSTLPFEEDSVLCNRDGKIIDRGDSPLHVEYRKACKRLVDATRNAS